MGALDGALWFSQFALALTVAVLIFRNYNSLNIVWIYLAFRAGADLATYILKFGSDPGDLWAAWRWSNYWQLMIQYVFLAALAMRVLGAITNADRRTVKLYGGFASALCILALLVAHGSAPWSAIGLLQIGARTAFALAVLVAGCLLLRELDAIVAPIEKPWPLICAGLLVLLVSNAAGSELLKHGRVSGLQASRWIACGQLLGLGVWLWAVRKKPAAEITEEAQEVVPPLKFEPESVTIEEERYRGWVN